MSSGVCHFERSRKIDRLLDKSFSTPLELTNAFSTRTDKRYNTFYFEMIFAFASVKRSFTCENR